MKWNLSKYKEIQKTYITLYSCSSNSSQIFNYTCNFDRDLFLSTSSSQSTSGELLGVFIHSAQIHIRAFALIPSKSLKITTCFVIQFFYNLFFQRSAYHWKKSKQIFDITAESCYHSEHFLVIESTSENVIFYSWKL